MVSLGETDGAIEMVSVKFVFGMVDRGRVFEIVGVQVVFLLYRIF